MNAFELLKADHERVAQLFEQLESASGREKLTVFEEIRTELELHAHIEEKIFYPALEQPEETRDLTMEAYEEHAQVKKLLRELGRSRTANEEWETKAKVLQENVEHHVEEEENELFIKARQALGDEEIEELGEQLQAEKKRGQRGAGKSAKKSAKKSSKKSAAGKKGGKKGSTKKAAKKSGGKKGGGKKGGGKKGGKKGGGKKGGGKSSGSKGRKGSKKSAKKR
jgi:hypothetical protein